MLRSSIVVRRAGRAVGGGNLQNTRVGLHWVIRQQRLWHTLLGFGGYLTDDTETCWEDYMD